MISLKMSKRTHNVECMKFYEAIKKNPIDENEILLKNYWIDRKRQELTCLPESRASSRPKKDQKALKISWS